MSEIPDTPLWQEFQRCAAMRGVLDIELRTPQVETSAMRKRVVVELTWRGGEIETLRFPAGGDLDALARALALELGIPLDASGAV